MPSYKEQRERYRRKSKLEAKFNAELRERANRIHELEQKVLFAEQPYKVEIQNLKIQVERLTHELAQREQHQRDMLLWCPECHERHIDEGEFSTKEHHTHACQHCGHVWRPAIAPTRGVRFLPGFKNHRDEAVAIVQRLKQIRDQIAVVGHSDRPSEIIDEVIRMVTT